VELATAEVTAEEKKPIRSQATLLEFARSKGLQSAEVGQILVEAGFRGYKPEDHDRMLKAIEDWSNREKMPISFWTAPYQLLGSLSIIDTACSRKNIDGCYLAHHTTNKHDI